MDTTQDPTMPALSVSETILTGESSRRKFLGTLFAGAAAATAVAGGTTSTFAAGRLLSHAGASIPASDAHILNYALTLEHLEATFYQTAANKFHGHSYINDLIRTLRYDEVSHVDALTKAIREFGYNPVGKAAKYNFHGAFKSMKAFLATSSALENTGVHAYLGQAPNIKTAKILLTAASIVTVEARHAGAISAVMHKNPTEGPFDQGFSESQVLGIAGRFIG